MASTDIGIDLGTSKIIVYRQGEGIVLYEPSVIAVNTYTGEVIGMGQEAYDMLGKTPNYITAVQPLRDGVISDYHLTEEMLRRCLQRVTRANFIKPRVAICVPTMVSDVERRAVLKAAISVGARKVYLIDEPIAAAIGAGLDISKASGKMVIDIGAGTADIAVISLFNIVRATSLRLAGDRFNEDIIRAVRQSHNVLIGERTAERAKIEAADLRAPSGDRRFEVKGRDLLTGLPRRVTLTAADISAALEGSLRELVSEIRGVFERTPPEMAGDILQGGILLTGGGSLLRGLPSYLERALRLPVTLSDDAVNCVAIGTGRCFELIDHLGEGFRCEAIYEG